MRDDAFCRQVICQRPVGGRVVANADRRRRDRRGRATANRRPEPPPACPRFHALLNTLTCSVLEQRLVPGTTRLPDGPRRRRSRLDGTRSPAGDRLRHDHRWDALCSPTGSDRPAARRALVANARALTVGTPEVVDPSERAPARKLAQSAATPTGRSTSPAQPHRPPPARRGSDLTASAWPDRVALGTTALADTGSGCPSDGGNTLDVGALPATSARVVRAWRPDRRDRRDATALARLPPPTGISCLKPRIGVSHQQSLSPEAGGGWV